MIFGLSVGACANYADVEASEIDSVEVIERDYYELATCVREEILRSSSHPGHLTQLIDRPVEREVVLYAHLGATSPAPLYHATFAELESERTQLSVRTRNSIWGPHWDVSGEPALRICLGEAN